MKGKEPKSPINMKLPWKSKNFKGKSKVTSHVTIESDSNDDTHFKVGSRERQHGIEKKAKSAPVPVRDMAKFNQLRWWC